MTFEEFKLKYQQVEVVEVKNKTPKNPLVTILIITYNHDQYIKKCIESVLSQQVDFTVEVLIGEDDSTDQTREICLDFAKRFPDKIRLFLGKRENNIYLNGKPTGRFNYLNLFFNARGKYIAICDGDDFWTDINKIQKQVNFLETNPEFALTFHRTGVLKNGILKDKKPPLSKTVFTSKDLILNLPVPRRAVSCVYNKEYMPKDFPQNWIITEPPGLDWTVCLLVSLNKKIKYFKESMGVYRVHSGGIWSMNDSTNKNTNHITYRKFLATKVFNNSPLISNFLFESINVLNFQKAVLFQKEKKYKKAKSLNKDINFLKLIYTLKPRPFYRIGKYLVLSLKNKFFQNN